MNTYYVVLYTHTEDFRAVQIYDEEALCGRMIPPINEIRYCKSLDGFYIKKIAKGPDEAKNAARKDYEAFFKKKKKENVEKRDFAEDVVKHCDRVLKGLKIW